MKLIHIHNCRGGRSGRGEEEGSYAMRACATLKDHARERRHSRVNSLFLAFSPFPSLLPEWDWKPFHASRFCRLVERKTLGELRS